MYTLNCRQQLLVIERPVVMGIINTTPDSFYPDSRQQHLTSVLQKAEAMLLQGAAIIDVGGQSTRPGSEFLSPEEELLRVLPAIEAIHTTFPAVIISIDTFYASVATAAVQAGASIINDISAGTMDAEMFNTVAALNVPYILTHIKGTPQSMQQEAKYENVTTEVLDFLAKRVMQLRASGVKDVIIDPGFGFGKTIAHNFELLRHLEAFAIIDCPLLVGLSRKSTIWKTLGTDAAGALNGTTVLNTVALMKGVTILRVHDVKEAAETIQLISHIM